MIGEGSGITIGLAVLVGGAVATLWWRVESRISSLRAEIKASINFERDRLTRHEDKFAEYRVEVERQFVSAKTLEKTEERLILAFDKLSTRVETMITRLEELSKDLAKVASQNAKRN